MKIYLLAISLFFSFLASAQTEGTSLKGIAKIDRTLNFPKKEEFPKHLSNKKEVWIFIMAGQSNMAGRGFVEPQDTIASNRILTLNKDNKIVLAKEPLHFNDPPSSGLDCGMSFAKNLLNNIPENVSVLLIPTAVGGCSINQWIGDSIHRNIKLLSNFKEKVATSKKYGVVKGILWHQGESDANQKGIPEYDKNLTILFEDFRNTIGDNSLPILMGELGGFRAESETWKAINNIINEHAKKDKHIAVISTSDLKDRGDNTHFNSEGQREMGKRFAGAYLKISNENNNKK